MVSAVEGFSSVHKGIGQLTSCFTSTAQNVDYPLTDASSLELFAPNVESVIDGYV